MSQTDTDYFRIEALRDGVYAAIAKPGTGAWSNAGIVDLGEELLVFDSLGTPSAGLELKRQAESLTGKKVKYVLNSHYHGDHVFGNQHFTAAAIIATAETQSLGKKHNTPNELEQEQRDMENYLSSLTAKIDAAENPIIKSSLQNQYREMSALVRDLPQFRLVLPSLLFEKRLVLKGSKRSAEFVCLGGGHTVSDSFLWLPEDQVLFTGDLVTETLHLPIYDPEAFLTILQTIEQLPIRTLVPGHGSTGRKELCEVLISYLELLIREAKQAHRQQLSLEQFIERFQAPLPYRNWSGVAGIRRNLETVYKHFS